MKQLLSLYHQLDARALSCLENVCLHNAPQSGAPENEVTRLADLNLVEGHGQGWKPTWSGLGVINWHKQLREALARKVRAPFPRSGENGVLPGPPCNEFRELLFCGIYCWCGRLRSEHCDEAVRTARRLLEHHRDRQPRLPGRPFAQWAAVLPSELRIFLQLLPSQGVTMQDLYHRLQGQVRFLAVQAKLNYLAELELVYLENKDLLWYPSWEGTGLKNWLHEQSVRVALNELMPEVQPGENGNTTLSQACENFRPLLSQGGRFCWCGHPFHRHPLI